MGLQRWFSKFKLPCFVQGLFHWSFRNCAWFHTGGSHIRNTLCVQVVFSLLIMRATLPFHQWMFAPSQACCDVHRDGKSECNKSAVESLRISAQMPPTIHGSQRFFLHFAKFISSTLFGRQILIIFIVKWFTRFNKQLHKRMAWKAPPLPCRRLQFCVEIYMMLCARVDAHATYSYFKKWGFGILRFPPSAFWLHKLNQLWK
jgi:hypothetical protein